MTHFTLNEILIYPIKSLAGISVSKWEVVETGLKYDRKFMLIDNEQQFLSQRHLPKMALIQTQLIQNQLILSAPQQDDFILNLEPQGGEIIHSTIWNDICAARSISNTVDEWFSDFLGKSCKLVYMPDETIRQVDQNFAQFNDQTAFSDGFPFLIIGENSLANLNQAMKLNLEMARFRPNLVIADSSAYAEDSWRKIKIGTIEFRLPKPCSRCAIPAINPKTAEISKEPLTTLNRLRKWNNKIYFGQNALHNQTGFLQIGDEVEILTTGEKQPPLKD